jgi:hypothetical protein
LFCAYTHMICRLYMSSFDRFRIDYVLVVDAVLWNFAMCDNYVDSLQVLFISVYTHHCYVPVRMENYLGISNWLVDPIGLVTRIG